MMPFSYSDILLALVPELILVISALVALAADLIWTRELPPQRRHAIGFGICGFGGVAAIVSILIGVTNGPTTSDWISLGGATSAVKIGLIVLTVGTLAISTRTRFTIHIGEFYLVTLLALVGMLLMAGANHLLLSFVALELVSLSFYCLVAFDKQRPAATEAALKYFLLGGVSAAITLFGISFIYGATHELSFGAIAAQLDGASLTPLLIVGLCALAIGFAFKIAAVPLHLWAPDVYQSAASPIASLIASASKLAGFYLFARIWTVALGAFVGNTGNAGLQIGWFFLLAILAGASLVIGNLAAIVQTSTKRLLAYSAIAHAGFVLLGIMAHSPDGLAAVIYYLITYGLALVGIFSLILNVERSQGNDRITSFAGLYRQAPIEAACLLVFFLSLAGIPPLAGFFGKFYLFAAALKASHATQWAFALVILAIASSAVSLYYYLKVLKQAYVVPCDTSETTSNTDPVLRWTAVAMAVVVLLLGCFPELLIRGVLAALTP